MTLRRKRGKVRLKIEKGIGNVVFGNDWERDSIGKKTPLNCILNI